ncbi:hypothetical protein M0812_11139 [Anaeramoeba flamelloides]|uniref:BTB domain-containing protein n=1 Tax=Anaeramoeba flamelloides TaxID=1746091 RepID=A0AAV7ZZA5_9EUKA|nr:hypothetical protein M0812_11139 [Anaeramoeba flamelloides]
MSKVKCYLVGDIAVGKTCMVMTYRAKTFPNQYIPSTHEYTEDKLVYDEKTILLELWDSCSDKYFNRHRPLWYPQTDVFLICFSLIDHSSLKNADTFWLKEIKEYEPDTPFFLIGTKQDLRDDETTLQKLHEKGESPITYEQGMQAANEMGADRYLECSSLKQNNLKQVFHEAIRFIVDPDKTAKSKVGFFNKTNISVLEPVQLSKISKNYSSEIIQLLSIDSKDELEQENPKVYGADIHFYWLKDQSEGESERESESESESESDIITSRNDQEESQNSENEKEIKKEREINKKKEKKIEQEIEKEKQIKKEKEKKKGKGKIEQRRIRHIINTHEIILRGRCPILKKILNRKINTEELERKLGMEYLGDGQYQMKSLSFSTFALYLKFLYCEKLESLLTINADDLFELKDLATQFENENLLKICEYLTFRLNNATKREIIKKNDQKINELIENESTKLFKCFESTFNNTKKKRNNFFDLILNIESNKKKKKKILTNKSLLIARTNYFKDLIQKQSSTSSLKSNKNNSKTSSGGSKTSSNNNKNNPNNKNKNSRKLEIDVKTDFDFSLFADLNQFLFTNEVKFKNSQHCLDLLKLSKYVSQNTLIAFCQLALVDLFIPKISNKNLLKLYSDLRPLGFTDLSNLILYFMGLKKNTIRNVKQCRMFLKKSEIDLFENKNYYNTTYIRLQRIFQEYIMKNFGLRKILIDKKYLKKK